MKYLLRNGKTTEDRRLDRLVFFDERSKAYPIRTLVEGKQRRSYTWRTNVQLDQGSEGACTGFSVAMEAAARPVEVASITNDIAREVYYRARQLDEWAGEAYEGSSVIAAMKAGVERGWYKEYRWALGPGAEAAENDLALAVGYKGPAVLGTYWYEGMYRADSEGYLRPTGRIVGGHAYITNAYSLKRNAYYVPNSWGGEGSGWIKREDMVQLLRNDGEAAIPVLRTKTLIGG